MLYPKVGVPIIGKDLLSRYMQYQYERCLTRAGASVWLLPYYMEPEQLETIITTCSGFLFPGGTDISPELYGQHPLVGGKKKDPARDNFELALLEAVTSAEKPFFCIGRGMQLLNVAFGGTLMQNMKTKQEYTHFDIWHISTATHPVELEPYSLLAEILHTDTVSVNSLHHQTVDSLGEGLLATADSPEGFAEALEIEGYPFSLAVQWRPEYMATRTLSQQKLFQAFVTACR